MTAEQNEPQRAASFPWVILGCLAGATVIVYILGFGRSADKEDYTTAGFSVHQVDQDNRPALGGGPSLVSDTMAQRAEKSSGLRMVRGQLPQYHGAKGIGSPTEDLRATIAKNEKPFRQLAQDYTRRYKVIRQYGKDWMSYPDLKQFNDDYMKDHDAIKFARGVAASGNFATLVKKYARSPEIMGFVKDVVATAPPAVVASASGYLKDDANAQKLVNRFVGAMGLPPTITAVLRGGEKPDPSKIASQIIENDPELKRMLNQAPVR